MPPLHKPGFLINAIEPLKGELVELALDVEYLKEIKTRLATGHNLACGLGFLLIDKVLLTPRAVFKGLRRDLHCASDPIWYSADKANVYIVDADHAYKPDRGALGRIDAPKNAVFAVTVRFWETNDGQPEYVDKQTEKIFTPYGVVEFWEWVIADPRDTSLPEGYDNRYDERLMK
jgi:hypothetical protein